MPISTRKQSAAFAAAGILAMPHTRAHIWANVTAAVPADVLASMTARQISAVISAAHRSYHDGRASTGAPARAPKSQIAALSGSGEGSIG
jgi:hypothetical protein